MRQLNNYVTIAEPVSDFFVSYEVSPPVRDSRPLNYVKTDKRYLFELRFRSDFDLALFDKVIQDSPVRMVEYQAANRKVRYFMTDSRMPDDGSVDPWTWVNDELPRIGAAIGLHFLHFTLPACRCVIDLDGKTGPEASPPDFKMKVLGQTNMPDFNRVMKDSSAFSPYATRCESDNNFKEALLYFGLSLDIDRENRWASLYRAYEVVADCASGNDGLLRLGYCSNSELNRFRRTCNHQEAVGAFSRHARLRTEPPPDPMDIEEALQFIAGLIGKWHESGNPV